MENAEQEPTVAPAPKAPSGGIGPIIGIIIIVILLALGGVYYFTKGVAQIQPNEAVVIPADEEETLRAQGTSIEISDIEADINASDFSGLDDSSANFDLELNAQ